MLEEIRTNQYSIVDGMVDWVRVVGEDNIVVYANKKMRYELGDQILGQKCYNALGKCKKCDYCIAEATIKTGNVIKRVEELNDRIYMVISSPMFEGNKVIGSVEVFRDITHERELSDKVNEKNRKMSEDIAFAKNMQKRMLPPKGMYNSVKIDYLYEASDELSGDFFDVFQIDSDNVGIYICDVVGHGVTASLLTIFVRQSLRTIAKNKNKADKILQELHKAFLALNLDSDKYFSVFLGIYNKQQHAFQYVNAGHNSMPVLLRKKGEDVILLKAKGYPICNIFDYVEYEEHSINLNEGDKLFFYTDGITETKDANDNEFGMERVIEIIQNSENVLEELKQSLENYSLKQKDDYAILMAEFI